MVNSYRFSISDTYQSNADLGPDAVKSSPWTLIIIRRSSWRNTQADAHPCVKPMSRNDALYSFCQPSAARRVPYIWRFNNPHVPAGASNSGGKST